MRYCLHFRLHGFEIVLDPYNTYVVEELAKWCDTVSAISLHDWASASALVKYVAVCVRVCWYCHQSGGTDVVDLPDILLPAGQYLDLFDSESETDVPSDSSDEELVEV